MRNALPLLGFLVCLTPITVAQKGNNFSDTPANHWAYQAMADLHSVGLMPGIRPFIGRGGRPDSLYELSASVYSANINLHQFVETLDRVNESIARLKALDDLSVDAKNKLDRMRPILGLLQKDLKDITDLFSPELRRLGVDTVACEQQARRDFLRVASFRWAIPGEAHR